MNDIPLRSIAWSGKELVAIGSESGTATMVSSTDGVTWVDGTTNIPADMTSLADIVWTGSRFVAVSASGTMFSNGSDVTDWTRVPVTSLAGVAYNGHRLVAVGVNGAWYSDDSGQSWDEATSPLPVFTLADVAWGGEQFVAVGGSGGSVAIWTSPDGDNWTNQSGSTTGDLRSVIWTGRHFVAAGGSALTHRTVTSPDGITWNAGNSVDPLTGGLGWSGQTLLGFNTTKANTSTCGWGDSLRLSGNRWTQVAVPAAASPLTVDGVFGTAGGKSGVGGTYVSPSTGAAGSWSLFSANPSRPNSYVNLASTNSPVDQSKGYWLRSWGDTGYNILLPSATAKPLVTNNLNCPSRAGCYEIPLIAPSGAADRANQVSFPFPWPVGWWEVRLEVNGVAYTPSAANTPLVPSTDYMRKQYYVWSDSGYTTFDDTTPGMIGEQQNWQGIWVMIKSACSGKTCKLLIPAIPKTSEAPLEADRPWLARALDWLIPAAAADETPPGLAKGLATRTTKQRIEGRSLRAGTSWYARLIVEEPSEKMIDRANVFGQLVGTHTGYDDHDLPALAPFGRPYLDLVFPHRDWPKPWGGSISDPSIKDPWVGSYNSDYRPPPSKKAESGAPDWTFEIRSDQARSVLLSWEGPERVIRRSELLDVATGKQYKLNAKALRDGHLWVTMTQPVQTFIWRYKGR